LYIPNYRLTGAKPFSIDSVTERNATNAYQVIIHGIWNNNAAVTSIEISGFADNLAAGSTASLYKITKA